MGRVARLVSGLLLLTALLPASAYGFDRFGAQSGDATYGKAITFGIELVGGAPDRLELVMHVGGSQDDVVTTVTPRGSSGGYVWDVAADHVTPNTRITYRWRAIDGGKVTIGPEGSVLYDDDRPGLDWRSRSFNATTVHWYGDAEAQAGRFGQLSDGAVQRAQTMLGYQFSGPVDIFVYQTRAAFFDALGAGAREWTGAATFPNLRTIFMYLEGTGEAYLERALVHELTHVVFHDATANAYHEPARWLNEGIAVRSETGDAGSERSTVEFEAKGGGLFAFESLVDQFPIGDRGSTLAYAEGTTMIDNIIQQHGPEAIARIAAAYRGGASDAEALQAGTGIAARKLYDDFYAAFGIDPPQPVAPAALPPSDVKLPGGGIPSRSARASTPTPGADSAPAGRGSNGAPVVVAVLGLSVLVAFGFALFIRRRAARRDG
ncbi:MAG: peptidase MA family metallohydrolase [Chloroflexota bacterium]|nr:peptidase MA family metallohydrolase [Chloroflexota bacterium]